MTKKCNKCGEVKPLSDYPRRKDSKDGTRNMCKTCDLEFRRKYNGKYKERKHKWYVENKQTIIERSAKWKKQNSDRHKELSRLSDKRRRNKINEYRRNKYHNDKTWNLTERIRALIKTSIVKGSYSKKSKVQHILGCSYEDFKKHIESQFQKGMSWKNREEWHLDHIIPVSSHTNEEELIKLNHYTNFQPLWKEDNLKKSNKYEEEDKKRFLKVFYNTLLLNNVS